MKINRVLTGDSCQSLRSQERIWILDQFEGSVRARNIVFGIVMAGALDETVLTRALQLTVERHELLRASCTWVDGEFKLFIADALPIQAIPVTEIGSPDNPGIESLYHPDEVLEGIIQNERDHVFDLSPAPLWRSRLLRLGGTRHVCIFNMHALLFDEASRKIFTADLFRYYDHIVSKKEMTIPPTAIRIRDYAEWQHSKEYGEMRKRQEGW